MDRAFSPMVFFALCPGAAPQAGMGRAVGALDLFRPLICAEPDLHPKL